MSLRIIPCAPGANIGEQITLGYLKQHLKDGIILTNYYHPEGSGTLELDLVLINFYGVWLIEVKHWWGKVIADEVEWLQEGRKHLSPLSSIDHKAKVIFSDLQRLKIKDLSVVGFVVLSKGTQTLTITDPRRDRVFGLNQDLIQALTTRDKVYSPRSPMLSSRQVEEVTDALVHRHVDPDRKIIGNYRLVGELAPGENYLTFEGQHIQVQTRRARIKSYQIVAIQSREHLIENIRRFKQDIEAISQLDDHPNIIQAYDFFADPASDDTYWLILELVDGRTLQDFIQDPKPLSLKEQMALLIPVAEALKACHEKGICHRNLTPRAVSITDDGRVKVGDFDFARVPALGFTISQTDQPLVINKYIAPEQQTDARHADHRADLYSLGALWYDLVVHPPAGEPIFLFKLDQTSLPSDARELLKKMLASPLAERTQSIQEVLEWFELWK
jgi:tRNA A-37 threonylcarbamoyl transferase component Bud32